MSVSKIKITAPGWETFTGDFGSVDFVDGVSSHVLPRIMIDRLAAMVSCALVDDDGNEIGQAGAAARLVSGKAVPMEAVKPLESMTEAEQAAERRAAVDAALKNPAQKIYSEAELIAIGENGGIRALRGVAKPWNVRNRDIEKLIHSILVAQAEFGAMKATALAAEKKNREAALVQSIAKAAAREKLISDTARNLTPPTKQFPDETPNAIGEDGAAPARAKTPVPPAVYDFGGDPFAVEVIVTEGDVTTVITGEDSADQVKTEETESQLS